MQLDFTFNFKVNQPLPLQNNPLTASQELINDFFDQIGKTIEFLPKANETIKPLSNAITKHQKHVKACSERVKAFENRMKAPLKPKASIKPVNYKPAVNSTKWKAEKWTKEEKDLLRSIVWANSNLTWNEVAEILGGKFSAGECEREFLR